MPTSCLDILVFDDTAPDGDYIIAPKADTPWMTTCDMTTDGGGWTGLTVDHTCNGDLDSTLTAIIPANVEGIDMNCRPHTRHPGDHAYTFDVDFPPGFDELYLGDDYLLQADAAPPDTSEINTNTFTQTDWGVAFAGANGDVSFGSADDVGPITSFAAEGAWYQGTIFVR